MIKGPPLGGPFFISSSFILYENFYYKVNLMKVLVAGSSGYLGSYIIKELIAQNIETKAIIRTIDSFPLKGERLEVVTAQVTQKETLKGLFDDIDVVISTIGITRQKDGLTYMDVDYMANVHLLDEAIAGNVKKFIYVSVLNGENLKHLKICEAKEAFCDYLTSSSIDYCIVRPNGFFSDMGDFLQMAKRGSVFLFGDGKYLLNPIHGEDLAKVIVETIDQNKREINVGGPDILSQNEIATLALKAYAKPIKIVHLPLFLQRLILWILRTFTTSKIYGPLEFFLSTMVMNMVGPQYGINSLEDFFTEQISKG